MHFLGLNGMPRRISDYPDNFSNWNYIASIGSMISLISALLFIFILYKQFTDKIAFHGWVYSDYFIPVKDKIQAFRAESFENLTEFPAKFHTYEELPVS